MRNITLAEALQKEQTVQTITSDYMQWVNQDIYADLHSVQLRPKGYIHKYAYMKLAKRGNDVYARKVQKRFNQYLLPLCQFSYLFDCKREGFSKLLYITLTYDTKICTYKHAWNQVGVQWNRFLSNLKKYYGRVYTMMRCYESYTNGHPHIHALLYFLDYDFQIWHSPSKINPKTGRKNWKHYPTNDVRLNLQRFWHSYISFELCTSISKGMDYIGKYIVKGVGKTCRYISGQKTAPLLNGVAQRARAYEGMNRPAQGVAVLMPRAEWPRAQSQVSQVNPVSSPDDAKMLQTLALSWFFRKRCFSFSYKVLKMVYDELLNSSSDLIKNYSLFQTHRVSKQFSLLDRVEGKFFSTNGVGSPVNGHLDKWHFLRVVPSTEVKSWKKCCLNFFYHEDHKAPPIMSYFYHPHVASPANRSYSGYCFPIKA